MEKRNKSFHKIPLHEKQHLIGEMLNRYCEEAVVNELQITKDELKSFSDSLEKQKHITLSEEETTFFLTTPMSLHKFRQLRPDLQFQYLEIYTKTFKTAQLTQFWLITSNYFYVLKTRVKKAFQEYSDQIQQEQANFNQIQEEHIDKSESMHKEISSSEEEMILSIKGNYDYYELAMQLHSVADLLARSKNSYHIQLEIKKD